MARLVDEDDRSGVLYDGNEDRQLRSLARGWELLLPKQVVCREVRTSYWQRQIRFEEGFLTSPPPPDSGGWCVFGGCLWSKCASVFDMVRPFA